jgi:hypothetical protein
MMVIVALSLVFNLSRSRRSTSDGRGGITGIPSSGGGVS